MTTAVTCPVGADARPCGGTIHQVSSSRHECDRDPSHAWLPDGSPAIVAEVFAEVEIRGGAS